MQAKTAVGRSGDRWEREADHAADRIVSGQSVAPVSPVTKGALQRAADEDTIQPGDEAMKTIGAGAPSASVPTAGSGSPIPLATRAPIEHGLGANLGEVRVHDDAAARYAADGMGARAFTSGTDIYLGSGHSSRDLGLMAHESTHVLQQAGSSGMVQRDDSDEQGLETSPAHDRAIALARTFDGVKARGQPTAGLIQRARQLHAELPQAVNAGTSQPLSLRQTLEALIIMYHELDRRITSAGIGASGLPELDGITWNPASPTAGSTIDIRPFGELDYWTALLNGLREPPTVRRPRHRRPVPPPDLPVPSIRIPDVHPNWGGDIAESESRHTPLLPNFEVALTRMRAALTTSSFVAELAAAAAAGVVASVGAITALVVGAVLSLHRINEASIRQLKRVSTHAAFLLAVGIVVQWRHQTYSSAVGPVDFRRNSNHTEANRIMQRWALTAISVGTPQERQDILRQQSMQVNQRLERAMNSLRAEVRSTIVQLALETCIATDPNMTIADIDRVTTAALREHLEPNVLRTVEQFAVDGLRRSEAIQTR